LIVRDIPFEPLRIEFVQVRQEPQLAVFSLHSHIHSDK
jgi:hypothetical protein